MQHFTALCLSLCLISPALSSGVLANEVDSGPLDRPLPFSNAGKPGKPGVTTSSLGPSPVLVSNPAQAQAQLRAAVVKEQNALEKLPRTPLLRRARLGERAAQVALGVDFAKEAALLAFAPGAANDALSDAVRWYSLAASRGFPGAPSLDQAGIRFYPVRIQREARR